MSNQKTALVLGGTGFIGHHLARRLKKEGYWVRVVDIEEYKYGVNDFADEIVIVDLRDKRNVESVIYLNEQLQYSYFPEPFDKEIQFDEVYCFACLMGGAEFVFTKENDADIMASSALMNINIVNVLSESNFKGKVFYSSSACIYPSHIQQEINNSGLKESDAWPANPDSCYGVEKIFSEKLYDAFLRNKGLDIRIARFHNIYGPEGTYKGGKEKAPAAMCRKVAEIGERRRYTEYIEVLGDGKQTRSFLYISDCVEAVRLLMQSDFREPLNIGSEEMVSINELARMAIDISKKNGIKVRNVESNALGVRGRNSNNDLARKVLSGWEPKHSLKEGMCKTYHWINDQMNNVS